MCPTVVPSCERYVVEPDGVQDSFEWESVSAGHHPQIVDSFIKCEMLVPLTRRCLQT